MLNEEQLKKENIKLKKTLNIILENAEDNEKTLRRFEKIEFKLMESNTVIELFTILLFDYSELFNIDFCTLVLADSELNISPLIPEIKIEEDFQNKVLLLHLPSAIERITPLTKKIYLGDYQPHKHQNLIHPKIKKKAFIKSTAILPLTRHNQVMGVFCCFSKDKNRFASNSEINSCSDYMRRLGYIISVCIENVINNEKLRLTSLTDQLTKIRNRRYFDQSLLEEVARSQRYPSPLSCLLMDIDHFKQVNDNHGHAAGDQILIQVVKRIQKILRTHEILARYGGEEFILLLPKTKNEDAFRLAQRIINSVNSKPIPADENKTLTITISIGLSTLYKNFTPDKNKYYCQHLVEYADQALYTAKETGRNKVSNNGLLK
jgi:two-component system, cell cycle response regulator